MDVSAKSSSSAAKKGHIVDDPNEVYLLQRIQAKQTFRRDQVKFNKTDEFAPLVWIDEGLDGGEIDECSYKEMQTNFGAKNGFSCNQCFEDEPLAVGVGVKDRGLDFLKMISMSRGAEQRGAYLVIKICCIEESTKEAVDVLSNVKTLMQIGSFADVCIPFFCHVMLRGEHQCLSRSEFDSIAQNANPGEYPYHMFKTLENISDQGHAEMRVEVFFRSPLRESYINRILDHRSITTLPSNESQPWKEFRSCWYSDDRAGECLKSRDLNLRNCNHVGHNITDGILTPSLEDELSILVVTSLTNSQYKWLFEKERTAGSVMKMLLKLDTSRYHFCRKDNLSAGYCVDVELAELIIFSMYNIWRTYHLYISKAVMTTLFNLSERRNSMRFLFTQSCAKDLEEYNWFKTMKKINKEAHSLTGNVSRMTSTQSSYKGLRLVNLSMMGPSIILDLAESDEANFNVDYLNQLIRQMSERTMMSQDGWEQMRSVLWKISFLQCSITMQREKADSFGLTNTSSAVNSSDYAKIKSLAESNEELLSKNKIFEESESFNELRELLSFNLLTGPHQRLYDNMLSTYMTFYVDDDYIMTCRRSNLRIAGIRNQVFKMQDEKYEWKTPNDVFNKMELERIVKEEQEKEDLKMAILMQEKENTADTLEKSYSLKDAIERAKSFAPVSRKRKDDQLFMTQLVDKTEVRSIETGLFVSADPSQFEMHLLSLPETYIESKDPDDIFVAMAKSILFEWCQKRYVKVPKCSNNEHAKNPVTIITWYTITSVACSHHIKDAEKIACTKIIQLLQNEGLWDR